MGDEVEGLTDARTADDVTIVANGTGTASFSFMKNTDMEAEGIGAWVCYENGYGHFYSNSLPEREYNYFDAPFIDLSYDDEDETLTFNITVDEYQMTVYLKKAA